MMGLYKNWRVAGMFCLIASSISLSACNVASTPLHEDRQKSDRGNLAEARPVTVVQSAQKDEGQTGDTPLSDPVGRWKIMKVHVGRYNAGGWSQNDSQIVGSQFTWSKDDSLLAWNDPENVSFDQRDKCEKPILVDASNFETGEVLAAMKLWELPIDAMRNAKAVKCTGGGRWGVPLTDGEGEYALFIPVSAEQMVFASYPDLIFLVGR